MRLLLVLLLSSMPLVAIAEASICPHSDERPWDKMDEKSFSKEAGLKQLKALTKYFNGEIKVADEFLYQSLINLEGSYLRNEMDNWKDDPKTMNITKNNFVNLYPNVLIWCIKATPEPPFSDTSRLSPG